MNLFAGPLPEERSTEIESGKCSAKTGTTNPPSSLREKFDWDKSAARKHLECRIWCCVAFRTQLAFAMRGQVAWLAGVDGGVQHPA